MLKKKNKLCIQIMLLFWVPGMQNAHPYFEWNHLIGYQQIFLEKSD